LNAMVEVLGKETATPEIIKAWGEAYGALAKILIDREQQLYKELREQPGGWNGKRLFVVKDKIIKESRKLCSLTLVPADGGIIPKQKEGQYLTVYPTPEMYEMNKEPVSPRNYSISSLPDGKSYRITIRRSTGPVPGVFSTHLIDKINVGDELHLGPPIGLFTLNHDSVNKRPQVFVAGGSGLTPLVPMIEAAAEKPNKGLNFYYSGMDSTSHPLIEAEIADLAKQGKVKRTIVYEAPKAGDKCDATGRINPEEIVAKIGKDIDVYVCGPSAFMHAMIDGFKKAGVTNSIKLEVFGPFMAW
jgi:nitric oxide dioxygenase